MAPLARTIYKYLLKQLRAGKTSLTYTDLSRAVETHRRSARLHAALGEVTAVCRERGLPALPAIVWRSDSRMPGPAYFVYAHTRLRNDDAKREAWEAEHAAVVRDPERFPSAPWASWTAATYLGAVVDDVLAIVVPASIIDDSTRAARLLDRARRDLGRDTVLVSPTRRLQLRFYGRADLTHAVCRASIALAHWLRVVVPDEPGTEDLHHD